VPLGADPDRFSPDGARYPLPDGPWLLTVARLVPHKGIDTGIEALALLRERYPALRYAIAGTGPDRDRLLALARERGVAERVVFLGEVPAADLPSLYRAATIYLGLSREESAEAEGFGLALAEAQASGVAVVAGRSGGIPDAVGDGVTGLLVPPRDAAAAAREIAGLLDDPGRRRSLGAAGRRRVEEWLNWRRVSDDLRRVAEGARGRSSPAAPGGR
ncbi:MAG TPA: glycosyltransferase family 4 protein, partial [Gemmatimonadales bacterium]|nr:glycosyltransferase family 4 protein [Gemmatimonadales bacterium]